MLTRPEIAWCIVDAHTGQAVVFDHRVPTYYRRRVAIEDAERHGFQATGRRKDVRICRVRIAQYS